MPNPTLREIVETFTEEELSLTVPIEFQDVSADDYPYVNEYNRLLASAQTNADTDEGYDAFVAANEYRTANQEHIDKYVLDAKKLNILMTLVINAYMFANGEKSAINTSYDNSMSGASSTNVQDVIDECFQSVSSGKSLVASAITDKKVPTDATATFAQMAANIMKIVLGSGNATAGDVLAGKTFTNNDGVEYEGTMPNIKAIDDAIESNYISSGSNGKGIYARMNAGAHVNLADSGYAELFIPQNQIAGMFNATATAAQITQGFTAWVNGVKIVGTRPLPVNSLTGTQSVNFMGGGGDSASYTVTFSKAFESTPTVTLSPVWTSNGGWVDYVQAKSVTKTGFTLFIKSKGGASSGKGINGTVTWYASVQH